MLLRQVLSLSRASGYVCRCPRVAECCNRRKPFKTVAQFSRQAYLPDEKISSYTADSVSAVRNAAKGLDAPFHVSGHVRLQQPLELSWQGSGRDCSAELPGTDRELDNLHGMCTQAVFGRGEETVCDTSYRRASALSDYTFESNFHLASHGILEKIGETLGFQGVSAEKDKLNLYRRGDFFKTHVDTPAQPEGGSAMFGTLVLCLPSRHEGGELTISHGPLEASTNWAAESGDNVVQWVAFYSDCPHEVRPVTWGTRLTISYKLFARPMDAAALVHQPSALTLQKVLEIALRDPGFPPQGRSLGFPCRHLYSHTDEGWNPEEHLKGCDAMIMAAAKNLGLLAQVVPVVVPGCWHPDDCYGGEGDDFMTGTARSLQYRYVEDGPYDCEDHWAAELYLDAYNAGDLRPRNGMFSMEDAQVDSWQGSWKLSRRKRNILWCSTAFKYHQVGLKYQAYGNQSVPDQFCVYTAAALVIDIPSYKKRQQAV